ncbi:MAG: hypothetical protein H6713_37750 [Myxococcales bacterium]|nr:hypothetical protein [Myxococcales bacterium]MCB9755711.1 hypothetical protein [Myxococcales bacterium]
MSSLAAACSAASAPGLLVALLASAVALATWATARAAPAPDSSDAAAAHAADDEDALLEPSKPVVGVLRWSTPDDYFRDSVALELRADFEPLAFALSYREAADKLRCAPERDDDCRARLIAWLSRARPLDYLLYERDELADARVGRRTRWIVIYDVRRARVVDELPFTVDSDDLILPVTLPAQVARALREDREPPAPMTDEERELLEHLDDPPPARHEPVAQVCLSIIPDYRGGERGTLRRSRCSVTAEPVEGPAGLLPAVALAGAALRRRRRQAIERLASRAALPDDVLARLRARAPESAP